MFLRNSTLNKYDYVQQKRICLKSYIKNKSFNERGEKKDKNGWTIVQTVVEGSKKTEKICQNKKKYQKLYIHKYTYVSMTDRLTD